VSAVVGVVAGLGSLVYFFCRAWLEGRRINRIISDFNEANPVREPGKSELETKK
jgi:hypothetical protein